jgi:hypothetical protein
MPLTVPMKTSRSGDVQDFGQRRGGLQSNGEQ